MVETATLVYSFTLSPDGIIHTQTNKKEDLKQHVIYADNLQRTEIELEKQISARKVAEINLHEADIAEARLLALAEEHAMASETAAQTLSHLQLEIDGLVRAEEETSREAARSAAEAHKSMCALAKKVSAFTTMRREATRHVGAEERMRNNLTR